MTDLPDCIKLYFYQWVSQQYAIGYLLLDAQGAVESWGGPLQALGFNHAQRGRLAQEQYCFLSGVLPLKEPVLRLPLFQTKTQRSVDIHIFKTGTGYGVLLLDQTEHACRLAKLQQKVNDLSLKLERCGR
jgi:hypothetical protein